MLYTYNLLLKVVQKSRSIKPHWVRIWTCLGTLGSWRH